MKFNVLFLAVLILCFSTSSAIAQSNNHELRHYDDRNHYIGKSVKQGNEVRNYDKYGHYMGKKIITKDEIKSYDNYGKMTGKSKK